MKTKIITKIFSFLILLSISAHSQNAKQLFIFPSGNNRVNGTIDKSFATLEKGHLAVRKYYPRRKILRLKFIAGQVGFTRRYQAGTGIA